MHTAPWKNDRAVRRICGALATLFICLALFVCLPSLDVGQTVSADNYVQPLVRIGIALKDDELTSFSVSTESGFRYGYINKNTDEFVGVGRVTEAQVTALCAHYDAEHREELFGDYDFIVDAIDLVSCKLDLIMTALARNIPIVSALGTGNKRDASQLRLCDVSKTTGCLESYVLDGRERLSGCTA